MPPERRGAALPLHDDQRPPPPPTARVRRGPTPRSPPCPHPSPPRRDPPRRPAPGGPAAHRARRHTPALPVVPPSRSSTPSSATSGPRQGSRPQVRLLLALPRRRRARPPSCCPTATSGWRCFACSSPAASSSGARRATGRPAGPLRQQRALRRPRLLLGAAGRRVAHGPGRAARDRRCRRRRSPTRRACSRSWPASPSWPLAALRGLPLLGRTVTATSRDQRRLAGRAHRRHLARRARRLRWPLRLGRRDLRVVGAAPSCPTSRGTASTFRSFVGFVMGGALLAAGYVALNPPRVERVAAARGRAGGPRLGVGRARRPRRRPLRRVRRRPGRGPLRRARLRPAHDRPDVCRVRPPGLRPAHRRHRAHAGHGRARGAQGAAATTRGAARCCGSSLGALCVLTLVVVALGPAPDGPLPAGLRLHAAPGARRRVRALARPARRARARRRGAALGLVAAARRARLRRRLRARRGPRQPRGVGRRSATSTATQATGKLDAAYLGRWAPTPRRRSSPGCPATSRPASCSRRRSRHAPSARTSSSWNLGRSAARRPSTCAPMTPAEAARCPDLMSGGLNP